MYIAYARISTGLQDAENQIFEIKSYCAAKNITIDKTITETISSKKKLKNRAISKVLSELQSGDTLIVTEISRIARKMYELMTILGSLLEKGIMVYSIKQDWMLGDDLISKVQAMGFALSADLERQLISQRTIEGLARTKANGQRLGRPEGTNNAKRKLDEHIDTIKQCLSEGMSYSAIGRKVGAHRLTVDAFIRKYNLDESKSWHLQNSEYEEVAAARAACIAKALSATKARVEGIAAKRKADEATSVTMRNVLEEDSLQSSIQKGAKLWAYIRVSCDTQTNENQQRQISQKIALHDWHIHKWCEEVISSRVPIEQRAITKFVEEINPGDILIVSEISRLGRSQGEVLRVFEFLLAKNVKVFSIRENYCFSNNPESSTIIGCIAMAANLERQLISQRTISALNLKKANGVILGRPKGKKNNTDTKTWQRQIWEEKRTIAVTCMLTFVKLEELSEKLGISSNAISRYCALDYGMGYFEKCQQLTGFPTRAEYIVNRSSDIIQSAYKRGTALNKLVATLKIGKGSYINDFCIKTFGANYNTLKVKHLQLKRLKAAKRVKEAKAAQPRVFRRKSANCSNEVLLRTLSQVASPETIANVWNCTPLSVREAQQKFGISSEEYKNNIIIPGKNNKKAS
jgi:DNA invertase Pin-like site-specific DNA recombinase